MPSEASIDRRITRFVALSSATSARNRARFCDGRGARAGFAGTGGNGSSTRTRVPCPGALSSVSVPSISVTRLRTIGRPSPVPPKRRVIVLSA